MHIVDFVPDLRPTILAAREMRDPRNVLSRFLPYQAVNSVSYRLGRARRNDRVVPVRAVDAPSVPIRRPGLIEITGDLPLITPREDFTEQDLTTEMMIAQQLSGAAVDWQPTVDKAAGRVALVIDNTFEAMRGQALSTLGLSLESADGVIHDVSFGADAAQITTAATAWNAPGATVLEDFLAAAANHVDIAGVKPGAILTSSRVRRTLLNALQERLPTTYVGMSTLETWLMDNDLPMITTYDRMYTNADDVKTRYYPEGSITFLPDMEEGIGFTELGITQEAVHQTQRIQPNGAVALDPKEVAGITVVTMGQDDPVQRAVKGAALGMPVIADIDQVTVLNGLFS